MQEGIVLCSFQFAKSKQPYIRQVEWNLVVIDEAHRLRNVYKPSSKIANAIKTTVAPFPKVLLTATPLQNSLLEMYGLVSIIDEYAFGDLESFRARYGRLVSEEGFAELRARLSPLCKRTLRKQVLEYVKYTQRHALVQEFIPSEEETRLYDGVTAYLQRPRLYALPSGQRHLMTLILRKLLASSTQAIANTLEGLVRKLEKAEADSAPVNEVPADLPENFEEYSQVAEEWVDDEEEDAEESETATPIRLSGEQLAELREEMGLLRDFQALAHSITRNSKGERLLTALRRGFDAAEEARKKEGAATLQRKAVIFTESRRTQEYLLEILQGTEFAGQAMVFNGTNTDAASKAIYQAWLERHKGTDRISGSPAADMRAALVEHFRDSASILIATEAAAEGINLQFCNLVVNYDLPWNPQRIEQRIGRCHRYGQEFDVVVVNFLNRDNAADQRVYELLAEKFQLFDGVFGASDQVLGAVESGVPFEKRIAGIYQICRTPQQIQAEFDRLREELEAEIAEGERMARDKLLNNFDPEVVERVRIQSRDFLDRYNQRLWLITRHVLASHAQFQEEGHRFTLLSNPYPPESIHPGPYRLGAAEEEDVNLYRVGHPLAQRVLADAKEKTLSGAEVVFHHRDSGKPIAALDSLAGQSGWLTGAWLRVNALEAEDHILLSGLTDTGEVLEDIQCRRLFDLSGQVRGPAEPTDDVRRALVEAERGKIQGLLETLSKRNGRWFDQEMEKLDRWAEDRRASLQADLAAADEAIRDKKKAVRLAPNLPDKLERQRELRKLESRRDEVWRACDAASREVDRKKDDLLDEIQGRLALDSLQEEIFTFRWTLA